MATAGVEAGLDDGLVAFYDFDSGFSDQLVKRNFDRYPPLQLWRNEEAQPPEAAHSLIKREINATSAHIVLETNTFRRDNSGNAEINHADPYMVFPSLGKEMTTVEANMELPSISFFFKVDPQPDTSTGGTVYYRLFGDSIVLDYTGALSVRQTWDSSSGRSAQSITFNGPLATDQWHHIYWRLGRPNVPQKLFIDGVDRSQNKTGDMYPDGFGNTGFAPISNQLYNMSGTPRGKDLPDQYTLHRATVSQKLYGNNANPDFATRYARYSRIMFFETDLTVEQIKYLAAGSYIPWHHAREWLPPANYLSLTLDEAYLIITDSQVAEHSRAEDNIFSVNLWVKYNEPIASTVDAAGSAIWIARRSDAWALGITSSGAVIVQVTIAHLGPASLSKTFVSSSPINSGVWQRVSLRVLPHFVVELYSDRQALEVKLIETTQYMPKTTYPKTNSPALILGSENFSGEIRSLIVYKPTQSLESMRQSLYMPHMTTLPTGASLYLHVHNGSNPAGLIGKYPMTVMLPGDSGLIKPVVKHIDAQVGKGPEIGLSLSTQAGCFLQQTYVDCGTNVFPTANKPSYTIDLWFMINPREGEDFHDQHCLFSVGNRMGTFEPYFCLNVSVHLPKDDIGTTYQLRHSRGFYDPTDKPGQSSEGSQPSCDVTPQTWHHIAVVFTAQDGAVDMLSISYYLDGKQAKIFEDDWMPAYCLVNDKAPPNMPLPRRPLIIGAELDKSEADYQDVDGGHDLAVTRGFNGSMRLLRVWSRALSAAEISEMYDWSWQPDDYSSILGYWSFETAQPLDYVERNVTRPSSQYYSQVISQTVYPGSNEEPLPSLIRTNASHTPNKRGAIPPWVLLFADITLIFVSTLTPVRAKISKLIDAFERAFQNEKSAAVLFGKVRLLRLVVKSPTLSKGEKAKQIANAMISLFKWFYKSGLLMGLLRCFSFNIFGAINFATLFVPIAGEVELALDLIIAAVGIESALEDYDRRLEELARPPQLGIAPLPTRTAVVLKVGGKKTWEIFCEPAIEDERKIEVRVFCDQGLSGQQIIKAPDKLILSRNNSKQNLEIEVLISCHKPVRISFEKDLFPEIVVDVHSLEFKLLPARPSIQWYREGNEWNWSVEFYVQLLGSLLPGETATWKPKANDGMRYDVDKYVFSHAKSSKKPKKSSKPLKGVVKGKTAKAKPETSKIELEGDGEVASDEGTVRLAAVKSDVEQKRIREEIYIYAVNANAGDAHTIWIDRREDTIDDHGVLTGSVNKSANAIIDGGYEYTATPMLGIPVHNPTAKASIDLVIATHFDADHIGGISELYEGIRGGTIHGTYPALTLIPDNRSPVPGMPPTTMLFATAPTMDVVASAVTAGGQSLVMAFIASDVVVAEAVFPRAKRSRPQAAAVVNYCKGERAGEAPWPFDFVPTSVAPGATFDLAGVELRILGPRRQDLQEYVNKGFGESVTTNRLSIINTMNSVDYPQFTSLWTGDAEDRTENTRQYLGQTIAIGQRSRHFTVLKVSHHGSDRSGTEAWFKLCTADIYLIGANGKNGNPDPKVLQWIINGHYEKARRNPGMLAPRIYITNPFNTARGTYANNALTRLDYKGGAVVYQRATFPANTRNTQTGYLGLKFENGDLVEWPAVVDDDTPDTVARTTLVEEVTEDVATTVD